MLMQLMRSRRSTAVFRRTVGWVSAAASARNPTSHGQPKLLGYAPRGADPTYRRRVCFGVHTSDQIHLVVIQAVLFTFPLDRGGAGWPWSTAVFRILSFRWPRATPLGRIFAGHPSRFRPRSSRASLEPQAAPGLATGVAAPSQNVRRVTAVIPGPSYSASAPERLRSTPSMRRNEGEYGTGLAGVDKLGEWRVANSRIANSQ